MTARIPSTTRVPASQTTRLRFAWTDAPAVRRRRRGRSSVALGLLLIAALALLSLGNQLADGVEAVTRTVAGSTHHTDLAAELPVMFAGLADGPTAAELVHGQTIAMTHCDFFADAGCQPFACVVETLADQSQRLVVFGRTDDGWAVAFEYRPDPRGEIFRGMLPEDINRDGVPELTTLWDTPNGGIRTRVLCRRLQDAGTSGTSGTSFVFVTADPFTLVNLVPIVAPIGKPDATAMREREPADDLTVIADAQIASGNDAAAADPLHTTAGSAQLVAPN